MRLRSWKKYLHFSTLSTSCCNLPSSSFFFRCTLLKNDSKGQITKHNEWNFKGELRPECKSFSYPWFNVDIISEKPTIPTKRISITFSKLSNRNLLNISALRLSSGVSKHKTVVINGFSPRWSHSKNKLVKSRFISNNGWLFFRSVAPIEMSTFFFRFCKHSALVSSIRVASTIVCLWLQNAIRGFVSSIKFNQRIINQRIIMILQVS